MKKQTCYFFAESNCDVRNAEKKFLELLHKQYNIELATGGMDSGFFLESCLFYTKKKAILRQKEGIQDIKNKLSQCIDSDDRTYFLKTLKKASNLKLYKLVIGSSISKAS